MATISADPSVAAADGACFFDGLPREIRDEIYRLAYTRHGECTLILRRGHSGQSSRRFPLLRSWKSGVTQFLVNKQWHTEALPQYFRHNRIHSRSADDLHGLFGTLGSTLTKHLISLRLEHDYLPPAYVLDVIRQILHDGDDDEKIDLGIAESLMDGHNLTRVGRLLSRCVHLSNLIVDVRTHWEWACFDFPWDSGPLAHGNFWKWHVTRKFLALINDLKELRGLQEVQVRQESTWLTEVLDPALASTQAFHKSLNDTMRVFEEQVRAQATKPRALSCG